MAYETIVYEKKGPVVTLTLNRPDTINAINPQMTAELHGALDEADADAEVRAIILTGAGRGFSAGFDIARRPDGRSSLDATGVEVAEYIKRWWARDRDSVTELSHLWHLTKPVIAAVHGWVMGGGFWYALASDITIAADNSVFAQPEVRHVSNTTFLFAALAGPGRTDRPRAGALGAAQQSGHMLRPARHGARGRHADERAVLEHGAR